MLAQVANENRQMIEAKETTEYLPGGLFVRKNLHEEIRKQRERYGAQTGLEKTAQLKARQIPTARTDDENNTNKSCKCSRNLSDGIKWFEVQNSVLFMRKRRHNNTRLTASRARAAIAVRVSLIASVWSAVDSQCQ